MEEKKLDGVAQLVTKPPHAKSTTDTDTHPLSDICESMFNLGSGSIEKFRKKRVV